MPYKNIVVAIDSSEEAGEVVRAARDLAGENNAALSLVTIIIPVAYAYGAEFGLMSASNVTIETQAAEYAKAHQAQLAEKFGLRCEQSVMFGQPASEIRAFAESIEADLIVIGSHGRHGLGLLLGSTANGVVHGAPCDVFVVRIKEY